MRRSNNLGVTLTAEEFESLREVSKGLMQGGISASHKATLMELGFVREGPRGLTLTHTGQMHLHIKALMATSLSPK